MTIETFRIYQTLAQSGVPYPIEPSGPAATFDAQIESAPSVWYVRELVKPEYDESLDDPTIASEDTGKRFNMFVLGTGPCLGDDYRSTFGVTRAYLQEGTYLLGFWYNGQLFGVPLTVNDPALYKGDKDVSVSPDIIDPDPPTPFVCVPTDQPAYWEVEINWATAVFYPYMDTRTVTLQPVTNNGHVAKYLFEETDATYTYGWEMTHFCDESGEAIYFRYYRYVTATGGSSIGEIWSISAPTPGAVTYAFVGPGSYDTSTGNSIVGTKY